MNEIVIPANTGSPELRVHVNPRYSLYQYLRIQATGPLGAIRPEMAEATNIMRAAINQRTVAGVANMAGYHGLWDLLEPPIALASTTQGMGDGLRSAVNSFAEGVSQAITSGEPFFMEHPWPERLPHIERAMETLRDLFVPHFPTMAQRQADQLDIVWPDHLDVNLVVYCYDRFEAYTPPVTVDVSRSTGLELCETVLHEVTHAADGYTNALGHKGLEDRFLLFMLEHEMPSFGTILDARHAVIFASSAHQVRTAIDKGHVDYAIPRGLYDRLRVPALPALWEQFTSGNLNEEELFGTLVEGLARIS